MPLLLAAALLAAGCGGSDPGSSSGSGSGSGSGGGAAAALDERGCITDFDASADYFPDKVEPTASEQWEIRYNRSYKVVTVRDSEAPDGPDRSYVLVHCGAPEPELGGDLADAPRFEVPIERSAVTHANALAMLDELDLLDTVVGMSGGLLERDADPWYRRVIDAADDPVDLGADGASIDTEATLGAEPDVVFMAGYGPGYVEVTNAADRGLPAVMISNRIEPEPLGSAEWLKVVAAFSNAEAVANEVYDGIERRYQEVLAAVDGEATEDVEAGYLCIDADRGCSFMYAHGEETLNGKILEELGVGNVFAEGNDAPNGKTYDYEQALARASEADVLVVYYEASVNADTITGDARYQQFDALADGRYLTNRDANHAECGATLYVRVDTLVRDFAVGMFPDAFPGEEGTCFTRAG